MTATISPTPIRLTSQQAFEIPECRNRFWKVNIDGVPRYPFEKPYNGDFIFACATVICSSRDGMKEWDDRLQIAIGQQVLLEDRLYEVIRVPFDAYNAVLSPINDAAMILEQEVEEREMAERDEYDRLCGNR